MSGAASTATAAGDDSSSASNTQTGVRADSQFTYKGQCLEIRNVYSDSLVQEMAKIREVVVRYKYIALDTHFPGVVVRPISAYVTSKEKEYETLRANVDILKIIQIGFTFCDEKGNLVTRCPCSI